MGDFQATAAPTAAAASPATPVANKPFLVLIADTTAVGAVLVVVVVSVAFL